MEMDAGLLAQGRAYAQAFGGAGLVVRRGHVVASWGDSRLRYDLKSTTKSIGATAVGLAMSDGLLTLAERASAQMPGFGTPPSGNTATGWLDDITLLQLATHTIVIGFGSSTALAAAYGIAVTLTMVITAVLLHVIATTRWNWPVPVAVAVTSVFLTIDLAFFGANALKIAHGGWLPLVIGAVLFALMTTWKKGREIVAKRLSARAVPLEDFMARVADLKPARVPGAAVFMTAQPRGTPPALAHNLKYNKVLHDRVVTLMVTTQPVPHVPPAQRIAVRPIGQGVYDVVVRYGFMEDPDIPAALRTAEEAGLRLDDEDITYFLGRETLIVSSSPGMARWRERLFVLMARNAVRAPTFFRLPPERVVELGVQVEL